MVLNSSSRYDEAAEACASCDVDKNLAYKQAADIREQSSSVKSLRVLDLCVFCVHMFSNPICFFVLFFCCCFISHLCFKHCLFLLTQTCMGNVFFPHWADQIIKTHTHLSIGMGVDNILLIPVPLSITLIDPTLYTFPYQFLL